MFLLWSERGGRDQRKGIPRHPRSARKNSREEVQQEALTLRICFGMSSAAASMYRHRYGSGSASTSYIEPRPSVALEAAKAFSSLATQSGATLLAINQSAVVYYGDRTIPTEEWTVFLGDVSDLMKFASIARNNLPASVEVLLIRVPSRGQVGFTFRA